jgi:hypothetical protein
MSTLPAGNLSCSLSGLLINLDALSFLLVFAMR